MAVEISKDFMFITMFALYQTTLLKISQDIILHYVMCYRNICIYKDKREHICMKIFWINKPTKNNIKKHMQKSIIWKIQNSEQGLNKINI